MLCSRRVHVADSGEASGEALAATARTATMATQAKANREREPRRGKRRGGDLNQAVIGTKVE